MSVHKDILLTISHNLMDRLYIKLRHILDIVFDFIVIFSIFIVAGIWVVESIKLLWFDFFGIWFDINQAFRVALNSILIVKVYDTLKMFVSQNQASLLSVIELWLIWLWVKIFFNTDYMTLPTTYIFVLITVSYCLLRFTDMYKWK